MSLRILIVDDEPLARMRIQTLIKQSQLDFVSEEAFDGVDALEKIATFAPQLVFLDIAMPGLTGFEVLQSVPERSFAVVFQTAFDDFAVRAFEESACDYLLKPFSDERFFKALQKASLTVANRQQIPSVQALEKILSKEKNYLRRFVVKVGLRSRILSQPDVLYFYSEDHSTRIVLSDIEFAYEHSLSELEEKLDPTVFLRVHRNALVNVNHVVSVKNDQTMLLHMSSGADVKVARERKKEVWALLEGVDAKARSKK